MADDMLRPFVPYYSMPSFTKDLPETKKLGIILKHLYFLKREGPDAQEELVKMLKETIEKYSTPHSGFYHDPRLLEVFLIQADTEKRPKALMRELYNRNQFRNTAEFYIVWAMMYGREDNRGRLMEIYNMGFANNAAPVELFLEGLWQTAAKVFGEALAEQYGFLTKRPIPVALVNQIKKAQVQTDPTIMDRSILTETPPPSPKKEQGPSKSDPTPPPVFPTYKLLRMLRSTRDRVPPDGTLPEGILFPFVEVPGPPEGPYQTLKVRRSASAKTPYELEPAGVRVQPLISMKPTAWVLGEAARQKRQLREEEIVAALPGLGPEVYASSISCTVPQEQAVSRRRSLSGSDQTATLERLSRAESIASGTSESDQEQEEKRKRKSTADRPRSASHSPAPTKRQKKSGKI